MAGAKILKKPNNPFGAATGVIAHVSMADKPFADIEDTETVEALTAIEAHTFNVVRAGSELYWCQERAWKTYRLSCRDKSSELGIRPSDQIEIYWWAFINYVYQFEERVKLYVNTYSAFAPFFDLPNISNAGKIVELAKKRLKRFTRFRHDTVHSWHYPSDRIGQLPLIEFMQENKSFTEHFPGTGYLQLPPKTLFRMTRRDMHSEMALAIEEMGSLAELITVSHRRNILNACYKVTSYTQWARSRHAKLRLGT